MRQRLKIASVLLALFAMALGQGAAPRRIHVNASATCGFACDGSAASPFASLVSALRSITSDDTRVELLVSSGDYTGSGNTGLTINFAQNVSIRSTHGAKATTIDCEGKANRAFFVRQTSFSLHGFTIQNCNPKTNGGAIFAVDSQVTLDAVRFINNTAFNGGAVYAVALPPASPTSMTITSSLFQNNKALNKGGAFYISRVLVTASNSVVKCNHASNKVASSGDDMYCEASSAAAFDLSSDVQRMGVSCPINGGIACSVTYQNWTGSSVVTQQLCDAKPTCGPLSSLLNDVAPDAPDFMGWCGNGICDEQFESCLSCPQDCSTCSFTGVKLEAFKCLPPDARNVTKRGICAFKSISQPSLVVEDFLPNVPRPVTGIMSAYFRVPETDRYTFKLIAQNLGAKLKINTRTLIDALFPNSQIDSVGSVFLSKDIIHAIEVEFFSARDFYNNVQVLFKSSNSSFTTLDNAFYSLNDCGDGILDPKENTSQPFYCADDVNKCQTYSCQPVLAQPNTCGNGICDEDFKEDCFVDCYSQLTNLCPQLQEPAGKQTNGIPLANDTLGILLKNQYYYRLPGVEHLMNGFDILNGEESALPVFYFGFCDKKVVKTIQDSWRGYVYTIPAEIFAQPFPQCSFSMQSEKHASSKKMAESKSKKTGVSKSVSGGGGYGGVTVSAGAAFSKEKSVKQASELETSTEGFLLSTEVSCLSSKAQMIDYTFHPIFLSDLATVENSTSMLSLLYKYGTHFYDYVSFGGKLTQVRVISKSFSNSMSSHDMSRSSQRSFSSSVSSPAASVSTTYTKTNEVHTTAEEQEEFENNSASSKIITYGGAPGSFGPQDDEGNSDAPTNFGEWARTVDLLPVPVDYQLRRISEILPKTWKTRKGDSIAALWQQAEGTYYRLNRIIADDVPPAQFKMILKLSLPANIEELMGYNNRSAAFIDVSFYDFSTNPNSTAFYNLSVWNENGAQVPMNYHPNSNGVSSQTNTLSFTFDAPVTLPKQATHVTVGLSIYVKNQQTLAIDYNQPRNTFSLNHVIMHDLEAGQQFYYPLSGNRTLSVGLPHKSLAVRPKKFRHNTVFLQYTVINLNKYPPVSPFYINTPYSAKITFVGSLNQYTVWQPLNKLSDNTYYWQNNNKARMIFEIYENVPPFREIGDLRAIQIRISGPRNSVWADPPAPAIDNTYYDDYKNASGFIGYYDRTSAFQDPETKHPNPMFSIGDIWTSVTRCLDLDDKGICQSSDTKGVSNVYVADDYKIVQLLADDETVWLLSPTESDY